MHRNNRISTLSCVMEKSIWMVFSTGTHTKKNKPKTKPKKPKPTTTTTSLNIKFANPAETQNSEVHLNNRINNWPFSASDTFISQLREFEKCQVFPSKSSIIKSAPSRVWSNPPRIQFPLSSAKCSRVPVFIFCLWCELLEWIPVDTGKVLALCSLFEFL